MPTDPWSVIGPWRPGGEVFDPKSEARFWRAPHCEEHRNKNFSSIGLQMVKLCPILCVWAGCDQSGSQGASFAAAFHSTALLLVDCTPRAALMAVNAVQQRMSWRSSSYALGSTTAYPSGAPAARPLPNLGSCPHHPFLPGWPPCPGQVPALASGAVMVKCMSGSNNTCGRAGMGLPA